MPLRQCFIFFILLTALTACMVGPNFHTPPPPKSPHYTSTPLPASTVSIPNAGKPGRAQHFVNGIDLPAQWWTLFHSPELNLLILQGLAHSPNYAAALATLQQAKDTLYAQIGTLLFPSVTGQFTAERQQFSGASIGNNSFSLFNLYNASVNVTYVFDVFGKARRQVEYYAAQVDYERYQLIAAYLALTSNITTTSITIASLEAQIRATHELVREEEKQLTIYRQQFATGAISKQNVLSLETEVAEVKAQIPTLEKSLAQATHSLAVLVGSYTSDIPPPKINLDRLSLPEVLPVSLPSNLVRQRPDVQAAEALLHAASAQIGVATAELFPQFAISGTYGYEALNLNELFKKTSNVWAIGGQVMQTLFKGGAVWAQRKATIDAYEVACQQYRQVILQAFQNVADALRAIETDARAFKEFKKAEIAARESLDIVLQQYKHGSVNYNTILIAQEQYQQALISRIQAQALRYNDTAALFQALGGGWWIPALYPVPVAVKLNPMVS